MSKQPEEWQEQSETPESIDSGYSRRPPEQDKIMESALIGEEDIIEPLSRRETEILQMVILGKTNKEIAQQLSRSQRTIEYHRNRLMQKLGVHNTAELVRKVITMGVI